MLFSPKATPTSTAQPLETLVAQTIAAQETLSAGSSAVVKLTQIAANTPTRTLTATASPTATFLPPTPTLFFLTPTPIPAIPPTFVPIPPIPPNPPPPPVPPEPPTVPCNWAQYIKDVTVPDGTTFSPGTKFTKIWRLRNIGSCVWTAGYSLVFTSGDRMQSTDQVPLSGIVHPGESMDVAVDLIAPASAGHYRGYWMLRDPYGRVFGIGNYAQKAFWVDIMVSTSDQDEYDFTANMCKATWRNSTQNLPCPGNSSDPKGSVLLLQGAQLENGEYRNVPTLWTRPQQIVDGWIIGVYPIYTVKQDDLFIADIGCLSNSTGCNVVFYLDFIIKGQPSKNLGIWQEFYDGKITRVEVDLSSIKDASVQFILSVKNQGSPTSANAFWSSPLIQQVIPLFSLIR